MIFRELHLAGAYIIDIEPIEDERGFLAYTWDKNKFSGYGLDSNLVQCLISSNKKQGTVRGMHYQYPDGQAKLVRCTRGSVVDIILDLRSHSPTCKQWFPVILTEHNYRALYIPKGFAHGFQTLEDDTELLYQMSQYSSPNHGRGIRWNDPEFNIDWPLDISVMSDNDKNYSDWSVGE